MLGWQQRSILLRGDFKFGDSDVDALQGCRPLLEGVEAVGEVVQVGGQRKGRVPGLRSPRFRLVPCRAASVVGGTQRRAARRARRRSPP